METLDYSKTISKEAVEDLRKAKLSSEKSYSDLGENLKQSRQSISKKFHRGDMKLSEFIAISLQVGTRPSQILAETEKPFFTNESGD